MLDWKIHGKFINESAVTVHVDTTTARHSHDLHQILLLENLIHEMFYVVKKSTRGRMNMLVGSSVTVTDLKGLRLEEIDDAIECLFSIQVVESQLAPIFDLAFMRFIGEYGHLYECLVPTIDRKSVV